MDWLGRLGSQYYAICIHRFEFEKQLKQELLLFHLHVVL